MVELQYQGIFEIGRRWLGLVHVHIRLELCWGCCPVQGPLIIWLKLADELFDTLFIDDDICYAVLRPEVDFRQHFVDCCCENRAELL